MIAIVPYDPTWPAAFDAEATNIRSVLESLALRVEHVGSTSVPGLEAKPVIDIQVSVATLEALDLYSEALARIGYTHVSLGPVDSVYPFFQKPRVWPSSHHIHLCVIGTEEERRHLAFRDYLRSTPLAAADYVELKRRLAAKFNGATLESRERYSLSKTEFVTSALRRALSAGYPQSNSHDAQPRVRVKNEIQIASFRTLPFTSIVTVAFSSALLSCHSYPNRRVVG